MRQGSLFNLPPSLLPGTTGLAGLMPAIRAGMNRAASDYEPGRKQLVDDINEVAKREAVALTSGGGKRINIEQLDKWLQPGAAGHAPTFDAIMCFCRATSDFTPLEPLFTALGLVAIPASELRILEYGKECLRIKKSKARMRALESDL